jgi:uncharacterized protein (TIGR04255 family)
MGKKMKNAPVYFVLAQVRFNTVLALDQFIPTIQDSLRRVGFPDFQKTFLTAISLNFAAKAAAEQSQQPISAVGAPQARYMFMDEGRTIGFVLDPSFMVLQTTHYDTYEPFLAMFLQGLEIVHKAVELSFFERLGVRFLDAVLPGAGESVTQYLEPSVIGLVGKLPDRELTHSVSETRTHVGKSALMSRAVIYKQPAGALDTNVAFPPDMAADPLRLMDKFTKVKEGEMYAVIDTDSWHEEREKFDLVSIRRHFIQLHEDLRRSFDLMVTPYALKIWG